MHGIDIKRFYSLLNRFFIDWDVELTDLIFSVDTGHESSILKDQDKQPCKLASPEMASAMTPSHLNVVSL